jgi:hypothetical protein
MPQTRVTEAPPMATTDARFMLDPRRTGEAAAPVAAAVATRSDDESGGAAPSVSGAAGSAAGTRCMVDARRAGGRNRGGKAGTGAVCSLVGVKSK